LFDQRMVTILGMEKLTAALVGDRTGLSQAA
jgi:hypothetical protein